MLLRIGSDRAGSLEQHRALKFAGKLQAGLKAVGLYLSSTGLQQARGLQRMRRQQRRSALGSALAQRLFWGWALLAGVAFFLIWWMQRHGWWARLIEGDPSGISLLIVLLGGVVAPIFPDKR